MSWITLDDLDSIRQIKDSFIEIDIKELIEKIAIARCLAMESGNDKPFFVITIDQLRALKNEYKRWFGTNHREEQLSNKVRIPIYLNALGIRPAEAPMSGMTIFGCPLIGSSMIEVSPLTL
jgi:hypothetical protein